MTARRSGRSDDGRDVRGLWVVAAAFLLGAVVSLFQRHDDTALLFSAIGFEAVFFAESNFDWQQRLARRGWPQALSERRAQTTAVGRLAQWLAFGCLIGFFALQFR